MQPELSLGRSTSYPARYDREVLCAVPRAGMRAKLAIAEALPFHGSDIWNAYELTWLGPSGKPEIAVATICIDASSQFLVESKSLKLYLNSIAMERFDSPAKVAGVIGRDLSETSQSDVQVSLVRPPFETAVRELPGLCLDDIAVSCDVREVEPSLLTCERGTEAQEELHSHLFRSRCPVTDQPDLGSVLIRYRGTPIKHSGLLQYLVSYRDHGDFHESCIERIFVDLKTRCSPEQLTVYGRFNRRGGLDINPFRSDFEKAVDNPRLWRQ